MINGKRLARLWFVVLACIALSRAPSASQTRTRGGSADAAQRHLYVVDSYYKAVYRFPVRNNGLPATKPDGVLSGLTAPLGVGIDGAGELFVADTYSVKVFAPGASGNATPIRALTLNQAYVQLLAVRSDGTLFVAALDQVGTEEVEAFAPGAHGSDKPIHIINDWPNNPLQNLIFDARGRLYVLPLTAIVEFDRPLVDTAPSKVISAGHYEFGWGEAMAIDEMSNALYANFYPQAENRGYTDDDYGVRRLNGAPPDRLILTKDCHGQGFNPGTNHGVVVSGQYLVISCLDQGEVLVYRKDGSGPQKLVESVGRGLLFSPQGTTLGP